jgi:hypothetical protein
MSYLVAPFCSELEELTYDLVEGAFRQEPSVSIDRCSGNLTFRSGPRFPGSRYTWDKSVGGTWPRGLLNHVGDVNLGIHDFAEFAPVITLEERKDMSYTGPGALIEPKYLPLESCRNC